MQKFLRVLILAAAVFGAARGAEAASVFEFSGTCTVNCSDIGLADGGAVSGWFSFADAAILPDAVVGTASVLDFSLDFGDVDITAATAVGLFFNGTLNAAADAFVSFSFGTGETLTPNSGDAVLAFSSTFMAGPLGRCVNAECSLMVFDSSTQAAGTVGALAFAREVQEVPEPGTLALAGAGLAGLALARRRKRIGSVRCDSPR